MWFEDQWIFMGEETDDMVVVLGCLLAAPRFCEWAEAEFEYERMS